MQRFPEQIAIMIAGKEKAVSILPDNQQVMQNYGLWANLVANAVVEMFATDRTTADILTDLQTRLESEIPLQ